MVADYVIEVGSNNSNSSWYRIWASGWKECGGIVPPSTDAFVTTTFPVTFSSMPTLNVKFMYGYDGDLLYQYISPRNITTTSFQIKAYVSGCQGTAWRAEGY